MPEVLIVLQ